MDGVPIDDECGFPIAVLLRVREDSGRGAASTAV